MEVDLYQKASLMGSKAITNCYSTSFSLGILALDKSIRQPVYAVYGFVRLADEIVDSFHDKDKAALLAEFIKETHTAIDRHISLNPVLHCFQSVVNHYGIDRELIDAFFKSMEFDLVKKSYDRDSYETYIYGSAEVVGLMCLKIFCGDNNALYEQLKEPARKLGSAFQKINFLRDIRDDFDGKGRTYFPGVDLKHFSNDEKRQIEEDIEKDFKEGFQGIRLLPLNARFGVYSAYFYYFALFKKIRGLRAEKILKERIRIPNFQKQLLLLQSYLRFRLGLL
jgi:phytoene/squalene synthetase